MTSKCPECHGSTTWDDSVGSAVCTSCGTLTDPSQSVLTSQYDSVDGTTSYSGVCGPTVTRRNRFSSSWTLIDQAKEARERRNLVSPIPKCRLDYFFNIDLGNSSVRDARLHSIPCALIECNRFITACHEFFSSGQRSIAISLG